MLRPLTLMLLVAACRNSGTSHDLARSRDAIAPDTRDSSGVFIHTHSADALDRAPLVSIDTSPVVTYTGSEDDEASDVTAIQHLAFLPSGDLVGFDSDNHTVVLLTDDPAERRTIGRHGEGPGDFGDIAALVLVPGGAILVDDVSNRRIVTLPSDLSHMEVTRTPEIPGRYQSWLVGQTSDGVILAAKGCTGICYSQGDAPKLYRRNITASSGRLGDSALVERFEYPAQPYQLSVFEIDGNPAFTGQHLHFATPPRLRQWGDRFLLARADRWRLEVLDTDGTPVSEIVVNLTPTPATDAHWQQLRSHLVREEIRNAAAYGFTLAAADAGERFDAQARNETLPMIGNVMVSPDGIAWVVDYRIRGSSGWAATAVDSAGRILGRMVSPTGNPPVAFGSDRVAFRTTDEVGLATIAVHRIRGLQP